MYDDAAILAFIFSSFIFAYLSVRIKGKHGSLQALFLSFALTMMMLTFSTSKHIATNNPDFNITDTEILKNFDLGYKLSLYGLIGFLTYFFIILLLNIFDVLQSYTKAKK